MPHIRDLDLARRASKPLRRVLAKATSDGQPELRSYSEAWSTYVRGRVVSRHAARLITQFMAACCGKSKRDDAMPETTEKEAQELPDNSVPLARVHRLLDALSAKEKTCSKDSSTAVKDAAAESGGESEREAEEVNKKAMRRTAQMQTALQITADLWNRNAAPWQGVELHPEAVDWANQTATAEQKRKRQLLTQKEALKAGVEIQCRAYVQYQKRDVAAWKKNLMQSPEAPNQEQAAFLDRVLKRCEEEHAELGRAGGLVTQKDQHLSEPIRDCLLGIPGAGKSHCIKLVRLFFEECLKWEDGVQFQFLAQQNTMAALIGGKTVNSWGVIPINPEAASRQRQGKNKDGDVDELFTNALGIRFLIIDECSTISPTLLAQLDASLRRACMRHPHSRRLGAHRRPIRRHQHNLRWGPLATTTSACCRYVC